MSDDDFILALDQLDEGLHKPAKAHSYSLEDVLVTGEQLPADVPRPKPARPPQVRPDTRPPLAPIAFAIGIGMGSGAVMAVMVFSDRVAAILGM